MYVEGEATEIPTGPTSSASRARKALAPTPPTSEGSDAPETLPEGVSAVFVDEATDVDFDVEPEVIESDAEEDYEIVGRGPLATRQQVSAINAAKRNNGWSDEAFALLLAEYDVGKPSELNREEALELVRALMAGPEDEE